MSPAPIPLELLAPARNAEIGIAAIDHGADAVYIGGPGFGARSGADNTMSDIARLVEHAHRYHARVYLTLNTILRDDELEPARQLAWDAWNAGVDALIVQDMGLLDLELPPIALHASTQMDNRSPAKVAFLEAVGFSQVVLARELSLTEIAAITATTTVPLEYFIHGALCVSYSGQCSISHALTGRSANRGECAQICRLPFSLSDGETTIVADKHLLSLKDNDQSANLAGLAEAGIRSFKIEGRLKDRAYVKNITAHYRLLLDRLIADDPRWCSASSGHSRFGFTPDPGKTFRRGATDYFTHERQADIGAFDTPKAAGEPIGEVLAVGREAIDVAPTPPLGNGDGIAFFYASGELAGLRVNRVEQLADRQRLHVLRGVLLPVAGTPLFRNRDHAFDRQLEHDSATRQIEIDLVFSATDDGIRLQATDSDGIAASADLPGQFEAAIEPVREAERIRQQLGKLGSTIFTARRIEVASTTVPRLSAAALNGLRRAAIESLEAARRQRYARPRRADARVPAPPYPETELSFLANVLNASARAFYIRHGVLKIADAYETNQERGEVSLMITRHCLRYSFNLCPKEVKGIRPDPLTLENGGQKFTLRFDCKRCEMHVVGKLRQAGKGFPLPVRAT
ncbi:MAG TPA: U32 family peptidase [Rhodocyclaceae bacterium]